MAVSDFYTTAEKQWIKILTIDPRSRRIEGRLRDRTPIQVSLYEVAPGFRWPQEGEYWLVYRENREWFLRAPMQAPDASLKIEDLDPGDSILGAEGTKVYVQGTLTDAEGNPYLTESALPDDGFELPIGQWITSDMLYDKVVTDRVLADLSISQRALKVRLIDSQHLVDEAVKSVHIALAAIDTEHLQDELITSAKLVDDAVTEVKIAINAISTSKLQDNLITSAKIVNDAITSIKIADGAILADKLAANAVGQAALQDATVTSAKLVDGAVTNVKVALNAIATSNLQDNLITSAKIVDNAIIETKVATNAIVADKIAANAVVATKIDAQAVTSAKIYAGAVEADKIQTANLAVDSVKAGQIEALAVQTGKLDAEAVTAAKIQTNTITALQIATGAITADEIFAGAITAEKIATNAVTAEKIIANAIIAEKIDASAVTTAKLFAGAVEADKIAANAVTAVKILAGSIETDKIAAGAVFTEKLAANSVIADKIATNAVTADKIVANAIIADKIAANAVVTAKLDAQAVTSAKIYSDVIEANRIQADNIAALAITTGKLAANAVEADKIAANAITAKIVAGEVIATSTNTAVSRITLDAANGFRHLNAGSTTTGNFLLTAAGNLTLAGSLTTGVGSVIDGGYVTANTITAEKITVGAIARSLILNGGFEEAIQAGPAAVPARWNLGSYGGSLGNTIQRWQASSRSGNSCLRLYPGAGLSAHVNSDLVPVNEGEVMYISCWAFTAGLNAGTSPGFYFRAVGRATLGGADVEINSTIENVAVPSAYTKYSGYVTIPPGIKYGGAYVLHYLSNTGAELFVDEVEFGKAAISTNIAGGALDTHTITLQSGGTMQTAESPANRVEFSSAGIKNWVSSASVVSLSPSTGLDMAAGTVIASNPADRKFRFMSGATEIGNVHGVHSPEGSDYRIMRMDLIGHTSELSYNLLRHFDQNGAQRADIYTQLVSNQAATLVDAVTAGGSVKTRMIINENGWSDFTQCLSEPLRVVRGSVTSAGVEGEGLGFTSTKSATGLYTVTFSTAFAAIVSVNVTPIGSSATASVNAHVYEYLAGSFKVAFSTNGVRGDGAFMFDAIGKAV